MIAFFNDSAKEHFDEVRKFAEEVGALEEFEERIKYLKTFACDDGETFDETKTKCELAKDFAPYSFTFLLLKKDSFGEYSPWFNGGLIYSGPGLPADGSAPSLTVSLDPRATDGKTHIWGVHT